MTSSARARPPDEVLVSVVVPVFNEAGILRTLVSRIDHTLGQSGYRYEMIIVNDGSRDESGAVLDELGARDPRIRVLHLSRNFGQQAAVQAGLLHVAGAAVVVMDADLQDDPEALPHLLDKWREGYDVVYAVRVDRKESPLRRLMFSGFYRVLNRITKPPIAQDAGNFGLIDRAVAEAIASLPDRDRYLPGLRSWVGFSQIGIRVARGARYDAFPRVPLGGLWRLAKTAIFSFSSLPLSIFYGIFALATVVFVSVGAFAIYHKLVTGQAIPGWTSTIMSACFFGAINALGISILGEYISRIYDQVRGRPLFVIARSVNLPEDTPERRSYPSQ